ncbi:hypothetical protein BD309DRAFT_1079392 [Dichomitus squalens]|uniref:Uncharacterized protein n=1 Tax=Dichomitus squalens TaxID=114155 RepID=A0A4Q9NYI0_9APHY|nr:hypothetical protein BD309DRAFT_1079392 [Dichomitus squalens]TBU60243.1 hypothetical protein BD310DRAFT_975988 [Dichomitus squalens]
MPSSTKPTIQPPASFPMELHQMITEDGRFVDIPVDLLRYPPPKPTEFLYFQQFYEDASTLRQDLDRCKTVEDAIDLLATELESMHALMSGYVKCLVSVTQQFDKKYADVIERQENLKGDFAFNKNLVLHEMQLLGRLKRGYALLKEKVDLKVRNCSGLTKLPIVKEVPPRRTHPPMTPEEQVIQKQRSSEWSTVQFNTARVSNAARLGREKDMVDELARPSLRHSDSAASEKGKGTDRADRPEREDSNKPLEPRVIVKVNKLAEGLEVMGETFARVQMKTEREFEYLRFRSAEAAQNAAEFWSLYEQTKTVTYGVGWDIKELGRIHTAYTNWAERPEPGSSTTGDTDISGSSAAANGSSSSDPAQNASSSSPSDTSSAMPANGHVSQPSKAVPVPLDSKPFTTPVLPSGAYAVCITMEHVKPLDELTREEAIAALASLPQQLTFVPYETIQTLETEKELEALSQEQKKLDESIESWGTQIPKELGIDAVVNGEVPITMVPNKRTEVYEESGPSGAGKAAKAVESTSSKGKGEETSLKRAREPEAVEVQNGTGVDAHAEKPAAKKPRRARKA